MSSVSNSEQSVVDPLTPAASLPMDPVTLAALIIIVALTSFICTVMGKICFDRVLAVRNQNFCSMASNGNVPACRNCHTPMYLNPPLSASHPRSRSIHRIEHEEDTPSMHGPSLPALLLPKMMGNATTDSTTFQRLGIGSGDGKGTVIGLPDFAERLENQHLSPMPNTPPVFRHNSDKKESDNGSLVHPVWSPPGGSRSPESHEPNSEGTSLSFSRPNQRMGLSDSQASQQRVKYLSPNDDHHMLITPRNARNSRPEATLRVFNSCTLDESYLLRISDKNSSQRALGVKFLAQLKVPRGSPGNTGPVPPGSVAKHKNIQPPKAPSLNVDSENEYETPLTLPDPPGPFQDQFRTETIAEMVSCRLCGFLRPNIPQSRTRSLPDIPDEEVVVEVPTLYNIKNSGLHVRMETLNGSATSESLDNMFARNREFKSQRVVKTRYTHIYDGQARVATPKTQNPGLSPNQDKDLHDEVFQKPSTPLAF